MGESVFKIGDEEIVLEVSLEEKVIVAIMAGEDAVWKGTLDGLKQCLVLICESLILNVIVGFTRRVAIL